uniref:hypothetical protein n=1 Tax=Pseudomonas viridiflava TaxID=33069 RepID=UPI001981426A
AASDVYKRQDGESYFAGRKRKALWESVIELAIDLMDRSCDRLGSSRPVTILELTGAIQDASSTHNHVDGTKGRS